ncbi:MAG: signal peptidase II [Phycisphaerales bacterium]|nr:signal peptidase II [Phycisphaerales bacterium]
MTVPHNPHAPASDPTPVSAPPAAGPAKHAPTWRCPSAWLLLIIVTVLGLAADLASKHLAFRHIAHIPVEVSRDQVLRATHLGSLIPPHEPVVIAPRLLDLTLVLNPGAVFGMGAGRRWFFIVFTIAAVAFALWVFSTWTRPRDRAAHIGLGLLLAGGLGNLYDRLVYGCVRDFLHPLPGVYLPGGWRWPWGGREVWPYVSNIADLLLIIGIALLLWHTWRHGGHHHAPPNAARPGDSTR